MGYAYYCIIAQFHTDNGGFSTLRIRKKPHAQCTGLDY